MKIAEIFYSIQGEGILSGIPSVFLRSAGCNLRCRWCDSPYAWHAQGKDITVDALVKEVNRYPTRFCVLTGGEPMIAQGVHDLARYLAEEGRHVTIETAATIRPNGIACALASLSPKLSSSNPEHGVPEIVRRRHEATRLQPEVIRDWIDHYDYQLKFVICSRSDIQELLMLLDRLDRKIPPEKVLLMPEGASSRSLNKTGHLIVTACKEYGFRYCDRLHIRLFGNKRGT